MTPSIVFVDNFLHVRSVEGLTVEICPHLGLMSLATVLEASNHFVEIFDPKILFAEGDWRIPDTVFLSRWAQELVNREPVIVGFTALGRSLPYAVEVARRIKQLRPEQCIIIGGPHVTIIGRALLESFDCFDVVVRFEAETFICEIVERLQSGAKLDHVPNLIFRNGCEIVETESAPQLPNLDAIPSPKMSYYPRYWLDRAEVSIEAGRGCPFACTFCSTAQFFQRRYRLKSNKQLIVEMENARREYGATVVNLNHDLFGLNRRRLRAFCREIGGRNFLWKCSMRPDTLDVELLSEMVAAGCRDIYFGVETGSLRMQSAIKKNVDLSATLEIIRAVAASGISCTVSFVTGFPDEESADLDATLDLIGELTAIDPSLVRAQLHILSPEPGSELTAQTRPIALDRLGPELDDIVDLDLVRRFPKIFSVFYHFESSLPRWRAVLAVAFITYILPELGGPVAHFLRRTLFNGSLAAMFNYILPADPGTVRDMHHAIGLLRAGLDRLTEGHGKEMPYLKDLLKFGRVLLIARREIGMADGNDAHRIAMFDRDMAALLDALARNRPEQAALLETGPFWFAFHLNGENVSMTRLSADSAREVQELLEEAHNANENWLIDVPKLEFHLVY